MVMYTNYFVKGEFTQYLFGEILTKSGIFRILISIVKSYD